MSLWEIPYLIGKILVYIIFSPLVLYFIIFEYFIDGKVEEFGFPFFTLIIYVIVSIFTSVIIDSTLFGILYTTGVFLLIGIFIKSAFVHDRNEKIKRELPCINCGSNKLYHDHDHNCKNYQSKKKVEKPTKKPFIWEQWILNRLGNIKNLLQNIWDLLLGITIIIFFPISILIYISMKIEEYNNNKICECGHTRVQHYPHLKTCMECHKNDYNDEHKFKEKVPTYCIDCGDETDNEKCEDCTNKQKIYCFNDSHNFKYHDKNTCVCKNCDAYRTHNYMNIYDIQTSSQERCQYCKNIKTPTSL